MLRGQQLLERGIYSFKKKDYKNALLAFNEILEVEKKVPEDVFFYLGNIFHEKGELGKAIKSFQRVLEINPNHTDAAISLSVLYNDIGRYEEAKKLFATADMRVKSSTSGVVDEHINKKFSYKHYELAEMYASYNRFEEALSEYDKAIKLDQTNHEVKLKLAKLYSKRGYISKAFETLKKLKQDDPTYFAGRIALGLLYYGNSNVVEAQIEWRGVLAQDPKNQEAMMYMKMSERATEAKVGLTV